MGAFSDYLENKILDLTLRQVAFSTPAPAKIALYTSPPYDGGTGTEVSGGGYVRQTGTFAAAANGKTSNSAVISFPAATSGWGTVTHFGIFDATTGGNLLYWAPLTQSKAISTGDVARFNVGTLTVSLD